MNSLTPFKSIRAMISVKSPNRVGIVAQVSTFLDEHRANIASSYAIKLGDSFCCHSLFDARPGDMNRIREDYIQELEGLSPEFGYVEPEWVEKESTQFVMNLWAPDRPGILREAAEVIRQADGDVAALSSKSYSAADTGEHIFALDLKVGVVSESDVDALRDQFDALSEEHGWTYKVQTLPKRTRPQSRQGIRPHRRHAG